MLIHVRQTSQFDCVIATVAMVANVSYEEAAAASPICPATRGLFPNEIIALLKSLTGIEWLGPQFGWLRRVQNIQASQEPTVVITRMPWRFRKLHCIAIQRKWVHDPWFPRGFVRDQYPWKHWRVLNTYRPRVPASFVEVRKLHWARRYLSLEFPRPPMHTGAG